MKLSEDLYTKPAVDKAIEDVKTFIDEVKEEVKKEDADSKEDDGMLGGDIVTGITMPRHEPDN